MTGRGRALPAAGGRFGPRWLEQRLAALVPDFSDRGLCVAFSGGGDSTALLAALGSLRAVRAALRAVHIDHGLHPESARWSAHAVEVARALRVPCEVLAARIARPPGSSPEARAREARYRLLGESLKPGEVLLTAHTQDDQLETVLLQLLRGAGVAGLAAMPELAPFANGLLVRPLLSRSHTELTSWARGRGLAWLEDPSNADERLDRNYLRWRVLPLLRQRWPGAAATVSRVARHAAEAHRLLAELARADVARAGHGDALSASALRALPPERRRNALRYWIAARAVVPPTRRLDEIAGPLLAAREDAHPFVEWPGGRVERQADLLALLPAAAARSLRGLAAQLPWRWRKCAVCELPAGLGTLELATDPHGPLDAGALAATLTVRWRRGGERLTPVRGGPRRALKSLLQESRVPIAVRRRLPLLYSAGRLVAVADLWLDQSVQAGPATRRRARLRWRPAGPAAP